MTSRIILVAPNWLGDAVMALPAFQDARRHFPAAHLIVAARPSVAPFYTAVPGVDEIVTLASDKRSQPLDADVGILFPNSFRSALLLKWGGVKERWGYR